MDDLDKKLIRILAEEGKVPQLVLAERLGISLSSCQRRLKSLEQNNVICGYRAIIDPQFLDEGLTVFVGISLVKHSRVDIQNFQESVTKLPMVKAVYHIAGEYDYILRVAVADIASYEDFHADRLSAINGIRKITSFITMSTLKN